MTEKDFFKINMEVIKEKHVFLYHYLTEHDFSDEPVEVKMSVNKAGLPLAYLRNKTNGRGVNLHSSEDPVTEASFIADSMELNPGEVLFLLGMGLGYLPLDIVKRKISLLKLFVVEKSIKLFMEAIRSKELSDLFGADNVYFIVGEIGDIKPLIMESESDINIMTKGSRITYFEPEREVFPDFFAEAGKEIKNQCHHIMVNINTSKNIGHMFFENQMKNFTTSVKSANVGAIQDIWKGKPAMVVGAGPSLTDNIDYIKKYRDRFSIIVVDSALPVLIKNGIKPDLAATVDFHQVSFEKYRNVIDETEDIPLVFASKGATMTLKPYRCPAKFFIAESFGIMGSFMHSWEQWATFGNIEAVSHLALLAARITGSDPIILVGFDLAYVGLRSYAEGTVLTYKINPETMIWVNDQDGSPVPTDIMMYGQRAVMEKQISESSAKFLNISRGVTIEGSVPSDAGSLLMGLPPLDYDLKSLLFKKWEEAPKPKSDEVLSYLKNALKEIKGFEKKCMKGMRTAGKAIKELEKGAKASYFDYKPLVEDALDSYDSALKRSAAYDDAIMFYQVTDIDLKIKECQLALDDEDLTGVEKIAAEMDFVHKALQARKSAMERLEESFLSLYSRLSSEKKLILELETKKSPKKRSEILTRLGIAYHTYKDFVDAEKAFRDAIKEDGQNYLAWTGLGRTLGSLKRHMEALECHKIAVRLSRGAKDAVKFFDQEKRYPEDMLDLAERYLYGREAGLLGEIREDWAIRICDDILAIYPENQRALSLKKEAEMSLDNFTRDQSSLLPFLMAECERAIDMAEEIFSEKPELTKRIFEILRKHHPDNPRILLNLGLICLNENDITKAKLFFTQARSLDPDNNAPKIHLATALAEDGKYEEALIYMEEACEKSPEAVSKILLEFLADLQYQISHFSEALTNYERFYTFFPERKDVLKKIGNCYSELGFEEAAKYAWELSSK